jgi:ubiquinone/menaquinone biosynthesis C-methylase UbiE
MSKTLTVEMVEATEAEPAMVDRTETVGPSIPDYLEKNYWWAYLNPKCVDFFEHQWIVNLILWGNFSRLRDEALASLHAEASARTLQIACVYGDFTRRLLQRLAPEAAVDVVDVAPIQLTNLRKKIGDVPNLRLHNQDASELRFADGSFDQAVFFFLLHELPADVRERALAEAFRVLKPGGRLVIVDYHRPRRSHPHRYLMVPVFKTLEPFALDLWRQEIEDWIPRDLHPASVDKATYFGDLYQKVVIVR